MSNRVQTLRIAPSNFLIVLASLIFGFVFFLFVPGVFRGKLAASEARELFLLAVFEAILLPVALRVPFVLRFFDLNIPTISFETSLWLLLIFSVYGLFQYVLARWFSREEKKESS